MSSDEPADCPSPAHRRPPGTSDADVDAAAKLSGALEIVERARGHLYAFHHLTGRADGRLDTALDSLREAGHDALAEQVATELLGRNVLAGRWTFQIVEEYDDDYYATFRALEKQVRDQLTDGRRHIAEAEMKESRRTHGHDAHRATPSTAAEES
ncbi:hypothetical protein E4198_00030 [Streptomyces sp. RKND-216]|uniref:hypothetical protein n=1 Tax=Streptomyces sp. RKND-216 TaxID=2562581 RepID=UPI00109D8E51|nr:hypothetical protein [Streptomyces sp. RKND-216]THA28238.1 hypothetical protein E4198_00030 [Streptomyces sp. RKND-216]